MIACPFKQSFWHQFGSVLLYSIQNRLANSTNQTWQNFSRGVPNVQLTRLSKFVSHFFNSLVCGCFYRQCRIYPAESLDSYSRTKIERWSMQTDSVIHFRTKYVRSDMRSSRSYVESCKYL